MLKCLAHSFCLSSSLLGLKTGTTQANGQIPQATHSVHAVLEEAQRHAGTAKVRPDSHPHLKLSPTSQTVTCELVI